MVDEDEAVVMVIMAEAATIKVGQTPIEAIGARRTKTTSASTETNTTSHKDTTTTSKFKSIGKDKVMERTKATMSQQHIHRIEVVAEVRFILLNREAEVVEVATWTTLEDS